MIIPGNVIFGSMYRKQCAMEVGSGKSVVWMCVHNKNACFGMLFRKKTCVLEWCSEKTRMFWKSAQRKNVFCNGVQIKGCVLERRGNT